AALHLSGVEQPPVRPPADIKGRYAARVSAELFDEGDNGEAAALLAFGLDPGVLPAGPVGRVALFRDDAFKPHPAGMRIDILGLGFEVIRKEKARPLGNERRELLLALKQRLLPQVLPV